MALILYVLFLFLFLAASFFALYQLWQFGYVGDASLRVIVLYSAAAGIVILGSLIALVLAIR